MFEQLFAFPAVVRRHREGPHAAEREAYLAHCARDGLSREVVQRLARDLLLVARYLNLSVLGLISRQQIAAAAARWRRHSPRGRWRRASALSAQRFADVAKRWLRFLGRIETSPRPHMLFAPLLGAFTTYMRTERGLSEQTIKNCLQHTTMFLDEYATKGQPLASVSPADLDAHITLLAQRGWSRVSIATVLKSLRPFFRYGGERGWCSPRIADAFVQPRLFRDESLPVGPAWHDVQRLLASAGADTPRDIRDTAILRLLAIYGLRASEVCALRVDDLDWEHDRIVVRRAKQRRCQQYPLATSVATAILRYLQDARPQSTYREVFLTLHAPVRPLQRDLIYHAVSSRLRQLDVPELRHYGPHALRHACAGRLVSEGLSLKEIGDQPRTSE